MKINNFVLLGGINSRQSEAHTFGFAYDPKLKKSALSLGVGPHDNHVYPALHAVGHPAYEMTLGAIDKLESTSRAITFKGFYNHAGALDGELVVDTVPEEVKKYSQPALRRALAHLVQSFDHHGIEVKKVTYGRYGGREINLQMLRGICQKRK